jgi:hypothetical protein
MDKLVLALASIALVAPVSMASAAPDKPINAASTDSGTYCIVRASETDPYVADPACEWHTVTKRNRDGSYAFYFYQDKGTLQPGQTATDSAVKTEIVGYVVAGMPCTGTEVISPSGAYSSNLKCSN